MFNKKLLASQEQQIRWLQSRILDLEAKLFKALKLEDQKLFDQPKAMKFDEIKGVFTPKTEEEIFKEQMALQDLLSANEHPTYNPKP